MKVKNSPTIQTNKTTYMGDKAFANLTQALEDALAFERGKHRGLKATRIQGSRPPRVSRKIAARQH